MTQILILHGWGSCAKNWDRVKELLESRGYKVCIPDLPGFGGALPPQAWSVNDYTEWVKEYAQGKNLQQFFLLGQSFGGRIAIKFGASYPQMIKGLILVDAAGTQREENWSLRQRIAIKLRRVVYFIVTLPILKIFYPFFRKIVYIFAGTRDYYLIKDRVMKETFEKVVAEDLTNCLFQIKSPTLIVWGEKDNLVPINVAHFLREKISGAKLEIIPDVKHNPHRESPEILAEKIIKFIGS